MPADRKAFGLIEKMGFSRARRHGHKWHSLLFVRHGFQFKFRHLMEISAIMSLKEDKIGGLTWTPNPR